VIRSRMPICISVCLLSPPPPGDARAAVNEYNCCASSPRQNPCKYTTSGYDLSSVKSFGFNTERVVDIGNEAEISDLV